jgi:hypothetical protein
VLAGLGRGFAAAAPQNTRGQCAVVMLPPFQVLESDAGDWKALYCPHRRVFSVRSRMLAATTAATATTRWGSGLTASRCTLHSISSLTKRNILYMYKRALKIKPHHPDASNNM